MILIVDDHEDTCRTMARLLRHHGYAAGTACDGATALATMHAERPELVILDYNMPGMNGLDVLGAMRASADLNDVPVFMFSAIDGDRVKESAERLGIQGYVRKGALDWGGFLDSIKPFAGDLAERSA